MALFPLLIKPRTQLLRYPNLNLFGLPLRHHAPISTIFTDDGKANDELNFYTFYSLFPLKEVAQHISTHRDESPSRL